MARMLISLSEASGELKMKSNEIIAEGPLDVFRNIGAAANKASQSFKQNQAIDRQVKVNAAAVSSNSSQISKMWNRHERSLPNRAELYNDPTAYYNELSKFAAKELGNFKLPPGLQLPDMINAQNTSNFITQITQKALAPKSTSVPAAEPAATKPVDTPAVTSEPKKGFYKNIGLTPAQKNAMALTRAAKGIQTGSTRTSPAGSASEPAAATTTTAAAPAASTPTSTAAAPAATSTLPTKAKSNTKAKDIDIDAALKMADTLSPEEKKKLLQDLLKSGVTVKAGGA